MLPPKKMPNDAYNPSDLPYICRMTIDWIRRGLLLVVCIAGSWVFSQDSSGDSDRKIRDLKRKLALSKEDTSRCVVLSELVELTNDEEWPEYNRHLKSFVLRNLKNEQLPPQEWKTYKKYLGEALNNEAFWEMYTGNMEKALHIYRTAAKIHGEIDNKPGLAATLNNMGAVYENRGDVIQALDYYLRSLRIKEKIGNKQGIATSLNNIGLIYNNLGDSKNALSYFKRSLALEKEINNTQGIAMSEHNIALLYLKEQNQPAALRTFRSALGYFKQLNDQQGVAYCLHNIGDIYLSQQQVDIAMRYIDQSLKIRRVIADRKGLAMSLQTLSRVCFLKGKLLLSKDYAEESLTIAQTLGNPEIIRNASSQLYKVYKALGQPADALRMHELFKKMNDSVYNMENQKAFTRHQLTYEFQRKEEQLKENQAKKELVYASESKRQRLILNTSIVIALLILVFSVILFQRFKVSQRQKEIISQKELETQKQKEILELKNTEITDSIRYAQRIQSAILPTPQFIQNILPESFILYLPKDIVAGDFYWFEKMGNLIYFAAADCTGHGVPGAMVSVICHNALNRAIREFRLKNPGEILDKTKEIITAEFSKSNEQVSDGMDISLAVLDPEQLQLTWSGANNPLWISRGEEWIELLPDKQPVGQFLNETPFTTHAIILQKGDVVYSFTDGFQDQFGGPKQELGGKKYKTKRLKDFIRSISKCSMDEQKRLIHNEFNTWKGSLDQVDDVCVIGVKI